MPRTVSTAFQNATQASVIRPALFLEGVFDSGTLRLWTGIGNFTLGGNVYTGAGSLIGIEPVTENNQLEVTGTAITLSGIDSSVLSLAISEPYQGRVVTVTLALLDASNAVIGSNPLFVGRCDVMTASDDGATCTITITVENKKVDLTRARARRYEEADQRKYYPTDRGFQFVTAIQDAQVQWGPRAGTE